MYVVWLAVLAIAGVIFGMPGITNRGKYNLLGVYFRGVSPPANFFVALFDATTAPTADTNIKSELTEIPNGNGYVTGGISVARNSTDFDVYTEDDTNDRALIQVKDMVWTASGGPLPLSGTGARYATLTDANATQGSREIIGFFDLTANRSVSVGQNLTLQDLEFRLSDT
jgi:hypothetical protein